MSNPLKCAMFHSCTDSLHGLLILVQAGYTVTQCLFLECNFEAFIHSLYLQRYLKRKKDKETKNEAIRSIPCGPLNQHHMHIIPFSKFVSKGEKKDM